MRDVLMENGAPQERTVLTGREAALQRALISLCARRGSFIYNRALGSGLSGADTSDRMRLQQLADEALARFGGARVYVEEYDDGVLRVALTVDGITEIREVRIIGSV